MPFPYSFREKQAIFLPVLKKMKKNASGESWSVLTHSIMAKSDSLRYT